MSRAPDTRPAVLKWFRRYCWLLFGVTLLFAFCIACRIGPGSGVAYLAESEELVRDTIYASGALLILSGIFLSGLLIRLNSIGWTIGRVYLIFSLLVICASVVLLFLLPLPVLFLYFWIKPSTKAEFGVVKS
jgi:hypothetical protein